MTDGRFNDIIKFNSSQDLTESASFRIATRSQVLTCYKLIHKYLTDLRRPFTMSGDGKLNYGEFNRVLASLLICMANSEPSHNNSYAQTFITELNGVQCTISYGEMIKRLVVTPLQFLAAHAESVYLLGRARAITFEFGRLHGLTLPGVGFIAFPYAKCESKVDNDAFNNMLNNNEHIRQYYFNGKLW